MKNFLRGMGSINLFSEEREGIDLSKIALTNEEAFKEDQEAVVNDMETVIRNVPTPEELKKAIEHVMEKHKEALRILASR